MEQIITLKVDLEYPEEAHHAIDEAVKVYEADKLKWTRRRTHRSKAYGNAYYEPTVFGWV